MKKGLKYIFLTIITTFTLTSCNAAGGFYYNNSPAKDGMYEEIKELDYLDAGTASNAYLSLDNSSYSYSNLRRAINNNSIITKDMVHIEEMLNYFSYGYDAEPGLNIKSEVSTCPWNDNHLFQTVSLFAPLSGERKPANLTFLVDCSGSMYGADRLDLFKNGFETCLPYLTEEDRVSIVTYASSSRVVLEGAYGNETNKILDAVESLQASGSTNGEGGIQKAYSLSRDYYIGNGNNHIFIVTDGDFNVGISNTSQLKSFISEYVNYGIYLSVFGVGVGNTRESMIETISKSGNGNAYYLDSLNEACLAFTQAFAGGVNVLTKDTKASVYFNPDYVKKYRIIGYETKLLTKEEYDDDKTDAGEIFEGYEVVICFEVELIEPTDVSFSRVDVKYKDPTTNDNMEISTEMVYNTSPQIVFASCVTEFGLLLYDSEYKSNASYEAILERLDSISEYLSKDDKKLEFKELVIKMNNRK